MDISTFSQFSQEETGIQNTYRKNAALSLKTMLKGKISTDFKNKMM
jgi:hypothetical protein